MRRGKCWREYALSRNKVGLYIKKRQLVMAEEAEQGIAQVAEGIITNEGLEEWENRIGLNFHI